MKRSVLITIAALLVILALAASAWLLWRTDQTADQVAQQSEQTSEQEQTPPVDEDSEQITTQPLTVYYIALEDDGQSGEEIGCGDTLVADTTEPVTYDNRVAASLQYLLDGDDQYIGQSGLYNALYQSDLTYEGSSIADDTVTVQLTGELRLSGECDNPRVEAQLVETAKQAAGVEKTAIFLNGEPLSDALSQR